MECIFCAIAAHNKEAEIVFERNEVLVIKDIHPKAPIHLLVIPKKHIASADAICEEDRSLIAEVILVARDAAQNAGLGGYKLVLNVGREGGQIIDHLHLHVLGGWDRAPGAVAV